MDRTERFYKIERMLRNRDVVPLREFLDELGVSIATFKRDLEYLRERLNAPIPWDRAKRGYRLHDPDPPPRAMNCLACGSVVPKPTPCSLSTTSSTTSPAERSRARDRTPRPTTARTDTDLFLRRRHTTRKSGSPNTPLSCAAARNPENGYKSHSDHARFIGVPFHKESRPCQTLSYSFAPDQNPGKPPTRIRR